MWSIFEKELRAIEKEIDNGIYQDIPSLFKKVPLELFAELSLGVPNEFPNIKKWFPAMPADIVQNHWTGAHGKVLLGQTIEFVKTLNSGFTAISGKKISDSKILDYGCGWGRIIRLIYKYTSEENIYAVDPWDESIKNCKENNLRGKFEISDCVPRSLPFNAKFDLIFSFSVFTHLSEKTTAVALNTLRKYIAKDGVLVITIRPKEYWAAHDHNNSCGGKLAMEMGHKHDQYGFAFSPSDDGAIIDGDMTYGDTSMTFEYINTHFPDWEIRLVEFNALDNYQIIVFLTPV